MPSIAITAGITREKGSFDTEGPGSEHAQDITNTAGTIIYANNIDVQSDKTTLHADHVVTTDAELHSSRESTQVSATVSTTLTGQVGSVGFDINHHQASATTYSTNAMHLGDVTLQARQVDSNETWTTTSISGEVDIYNAVAHQDKTETRGVDVSVTTGGSGSISVTHSTDKTTAISTPYTTNEDHLQVNIFNSVGIVIPSSLQADEKYSQILQDEKRSSQYHISGSLLGLPTDVASGISVSVHQDQYEAARGITVDPFITRDTHQGGEMYIPIPHKDGIDILKDNSHHVFQQEDKQKQTPTPNTEPAPAESTSPAQREPIKEIRETPFEQMSELDAILNAPIVINDPFAINADFIFAGEQIQDAPPDAQNQHEALWIQPYFDTTTAQESDTPVILEYAEAIKEGFVEGAIGLPVDVAYFLGDSALIAFTYLPEPIIPYLCHHYFGIKQDDVRSWPSVNHAFERMDKRSLILRANLSFFNDLGWVTLDQFSHIPVPLLYAVGGIAHNFSYMQEAYAHMNEYWLSFKEYSVQSTGPQRAAFFSELIGAFLVGGLEERVGELLAPYWSSAAKLKHYHAAEKLNASSQVKFEFDRDIAYTIQQHSSQMIKESDSKKIEAKGTFKPTAENRENYNMAWIAGLFSVSETPKAQSGAVSRGRAPFF